jgi:hypothetical protein
MKEVRIFGNVNVIDGFVKRGKSRKTVIPACPESHFISKLYGNMIPDKRE